LPIRITEIDRGRRRGLGGAGCRGSEGRLRGGDTRRFELFDARLERAHAPGVLGLERRDLGMQRGHVGITGCLADGGQDRRGTCHDGQAG
jgi:hypothetical protein